jgi:hypothetical protein
VERTAAQIADWTDTPQMLASREARLFLAAQEQRYAAPAMLQAAQDAKGKEHAALSDAFNEKQRPRTLLEQHHDKAEVSGRQS